MLPDGEEGELVLTTLSKQAMPMIRYRTRDITSLIPEPCACGRTIRRIRRIGRRSDDMFIIRGVNVFPSQIETALLAVEGTLPHYQIILTREKGLDQMEVQVEVTPEVFSDKVRALEALQHKLEQALEHTLGIRVGVSLVDPHTIQRSEGKAKRVIDKRQIRRPEATTMKLNQLSLFLENSPGALRLPCQVLAQAGINILTLSLADTQQFGILRLIVKDATGPSKVLEEAGCVVKVTEVVAVEVPDRPGGLADMLGAFEGTGLNIEYMYAFAGHRGKTAVLILRFEDPEKAAGAPGGAQGPRPRPRGSLRGRRAPDGPAMMTPAENRIWDPAELLPRDRLAELQLDRLRESVARAGVTPFYDAALSRGRRGPRGHPHPRRPAAAAVHHQGRPAGPLPARLPGRAARRDRAHPRLVGHHRQAHLRGLQPRRPADLGGPVRPLPGGRRAAARAPGARRLRLRPVHRRLRPALRHRAGRRGHRARWPAATLRGR